MAPLAGRLPNKRRDKMNGFFINSIQKIIKQREEQPPEQVDIALNNVQLAITHEVMFFKCLFLHVEASRLPPADVGCTNQQGECVCGTL